MLTAHLVELAAGLSTWERLHAEGAAGSPFQSPAWARAWWTHLATGVRPWTLELRDGDRPVGLVPLALRQGPARRLEPVGIEPGDLWDVVALPGAEADAASALLHALDDHRGDWDAWVVRCLPADSRAASALTAPGAIQLPTTPAPAIELPATFDEYLARLSSSRRQNLRRHLRRVDAGEIVLREVTDPAAVPAAIERWQAFRRTQWESAGRDIDPSHLRPELAAFTSAVVQALLPPGQALLWEVDVEGETVGCYVNFADATTFHWWLGGFDPAHARLGLGKIAVGHGIRTSIEAGRRWFDFGRGDEAYKYWFGAEDRPLERGIAFNPTPRSRLARVGARLALARAARRTAAAAAAD